MIKYDKKYPERINPIVESAITEKKTPYHIPELKDVPFEDIASEQFRMLQEALRRYAGIKITHASQLLPAFQEAVNKVLELEAEYSDELIALAVKLVEDYYGINPNEVGFDVTLGATYIEIQPGNEPDELLSEDSELTEEIQAEIKKRHVANAFIQGAGMRAQNLFHLANDILALISPELVRLYALLTAFSHYLYWTIPSIGARGGLAAGKVQLNLSESKPIIVAQAVVFPILLQELVKGVMELVSAHGLSRNPKVRARALQETDTLANEVWGIRFGPDFWQKFVNATQDITPRQRMYVYEQLITLPLAQYLRIVNDLVSGKPEGQAAINLIINQLGFQKTSSFLPSLRLMAEE